MLEKKKPRIDYARRNIYGNSTQPTLVWDFKTQLCCISKKLGTRLWAAINHGRPQNFAWFMDNFTVFFLHNAATLASLPSLLHFIRTRNVFSTILARNEILPLIRARHCKQLELEIVKINLQAVLELFALVIFRLRDKYKFYVQLREWRYYLCREIVIITTNKHYRRYLFIYLRFLLLLLFLRWLKSHRKTDTSSIHLFLIWQIRVSDTKNVSISFAVILQDQ